MCIYVYHIRKKVFCSYIFLSLHTYICLPIWKEWESFVTKLKFIWSKPTRALGSANISANTNKNNIPSFMARKWKKIIDINQLLPTKVYVRHIPILVVLSKSSAGKIKYTTLDQNWLCFRKVIWLKTISNMSVHLHPTCKGKKSFKKKQFLSLIVHSNV